MSHPIINNVDVDQLPDHVQDAIYLEFNKLPVKYKLVVFSKLIHGHLFKVTSNDFFNINKQTPGTVYRTFINDITEQLHEHV